MAAPERPCTAHDQRPLTPLQFELGVVGSDPREIAWAAGRRNQRAHSPDPRSREDRARANRMLMWLVEHASGDGA